MTEVMERRIAHANKVTQHHEQFITPTTITFMGSSKDRNINISQKKRDLFKVILKIDENARIIDKNDKEYNSPEELPEGISFSEVFPIEDTDKRYGNIHVQCQIKSKFTLYDLKRGPLNILQYLIDNKIFLKFRKFSTITEATIGFLHGIHPNETLRSDLRQDIDNYLKSSELKPEEKTLLTKDNSSQPSSDDNKTITFPPYDIVVNSFGYGNGPTRITTKAYEVRCAPTDATILKKLFTRISLTSKYNLNFMPAGMLQLSGQTAYKNALRSHNEYLTKFATFPVYGLNIQQMSSVRDEMLQHSSIKRILKTNKSDTTGRWLIETTQNSITNAQQVVDNILNKNDQIDTDATSRINPDLLTDELVLLSKSVSNTYKEAPNDNQNTFSTPPTHNPRLIS